MVKSGGVVEWVRTREEYQRRREVGERIERVEGGGGFERRRGGRRFWEEWDC